MYNNIHVYVKKNLGVIPLSLTSYILVLLAISISAYRSSSYFATGNDNDYSSVYYKRNPTHKMSVYGKRAADENFGNADTLEYDWIF